MDFIETVTKMTDEEKVNILTGKDTWNTADYGDIASVKMSDGPHGLRVEKDSKKKGLNDSYTATCFPTASALACTWNQSLIGEVGELIGEEAALSKVNVVLGPGVNIKRNPLCGRNFEYYSEDPYLAGKLGAAMIKGLQKNGTGACVKHFAANNQEYRRMTVNAVVDERALREIYLTPFEIAVKEGMPKMVMTAYNRVNGVYANENTHLLNILRNDWQFDGVVTSDWGGCNSQVAALKAGSDLSMPRGRLFKDELLAALKNGEIEKDLVDTSVNRIFKLQKETSESGKAGEHGIEPDYNLQIAQKAAEESIVLLKNNILPLNHFDPIVFIGDLVFDTPCQGAGSSRVHQRKKENLIDLLYDYELNVKSVLKDNFTEDKKCSVEISQSDVAVVVLGYPDGTESEGRDRENMSLPESQKCLYRSIRSRFSKVVAVVISGSAVELNFVNDCDALLYCPLGGERTSAAIMKVLCGKTNPSGKLAETFPLSFDDLPTNGFSDDFKTEYRESIYVGYRYYEKAKVPVLYPFGHGLSYTTFSYSQALADKNGVRFTIKNVGDYDGAETCQIYVSKQESKIYRPVKELKGFIKVFLRAGEQKTVTVPFDDKTFRYFDVDTGRFEREAGNYKIYVASSSEDIRLSVAVLISGTAKINRKDNIDNYFSGTIKGITSEEFYRVYGREVPDEGYEFYKKKRIKVDLNTTVSDLRFAKSMLARIIGRHYYKKLKKSEKLPPKKANDLSMIACLPTRTIANFLDYSEVNARGLLEILNGKFFKGLKLLLKK